jgi:hypothetical protein
VPWLPAASILTNVFLMTKLSLHTWIRFSVWMGVGFLIYGLYGWRNSSGTSQSHLYLTTMLLRTVTGSSKLKLSFLLLYMMNLFLSVTIQIPGMPCRVVEWSQIYFTPEPVF